MTLFPGLRLNIGKRSISTTIESNGFSLGIGRQGVYGNVGIKGTGISYRTKLIKNQRKASGFNNRQSVENPVFGVRQAME